MAYSPLLIGDVFSVVVVVGVVVGVDTFSTNVMVLVVLLLVVTVFGNPVTVTVFKTAC